MLFRICLFINSLLAVDTPGKPSGSESSGDGDTSVDVIYKALGIILPTALGVILLCGTIYSVVIGVQYSKADDAAARAIAKKKLINAIFGFGIVLVLIAILYAIREPLVKFAVSNSK